MYNNIRPVRRDPKYIFDDWYTKPQSGNYRYRIGPFTYDSGDPPKGKEFPKRKDQVLRWKTPYARESFAKVKRSGHIKMTPYSRGTSKAVYFLAAVPHYNVHLGHPHDVDGSYIGPEIKRVTSWMEVGDYDYWFNNVDAHLNSLDDLQDNQFYHARQRAMADVVSKSFSGYDLLTEMVEAKSTFESLRTLLFKARHPLEAFGELRRRFDAQRTNPRKWAFAERKLREHWLKYRYELMPIIYSIQDIFETLEHRNDLYKTDRSHERVVLDRMSIPTAGTGIYFCNLTRGRIHVRATGKARFSSSRFGVLRLADLVSLNPAITAWEKVPYSFVLDWFINIGDYLAAMTSSWQDFAEQREFCLSVKSSIYEEAVLVDTRTHVFHKDYPDFVGDVHLELPAGRRVQTLMTKEIESYDRKLFSPYDIEINFNPSMTWKRWIDAYALSMPHLIKALRSLK